MFQINLNAGNDSINLNCDETVNRMESCNFEHKMTGKRPLLHFFSSFCVEIYSIECNTKEVEKLAEQKRNCLRCLMQIRVRNFLTLTQICREIWSSSLFRTFQRTINRKTELLLRR